MTHSDFLQVVNNGPELVSTNFWESAYNQHGLFYLTWNARVARLLVPISLEHTLTEMRTGKKAFIERSIVYRKHFDLVFDDGTQAPFCIAMSKHQTDRALTHGQSFLWIYTRNGKQFELPLSIDAEGRPL